MISRLDKFAKKFSNNRMRQAFNELETSMRDGKLMKKCLNHILKHRFNRLSRAMEIWKRLPTKKDQQKVTAIADIE